MFTESEKRPGMSTFEAYRETLRAGIKVTFKDEPEFCDAQLRRYDRLLTVKDREEKTYWRIPRVRMVYANLASGNLSEPRFVPASKKRWRKIKKKALKAQKKQRVKEFLANQLEIRRNAGKPKTVRLKQWLLDRASLKLARWRKKYPHLFKPVEDVESNEERNEEQNE